MEKIIFLALFSLFYLEGSSQHQCGNTNSIPIGTSQSGNINNIDFFSESSCEPLYIKVNFVFLTRNDGTGSIPNGDPMINEFVGGMNNLLASIGDPGLCSSDPDYPYDSNIRIDLQGVHYINNTQAWDYYAQAVNLGTSYGSFDFCPGSLSNSWPALHTVVNSFNNQHPGEYNYFFVEDGTELAYMQNAVNNNIPITQPGSTFGNISIFSGCSEWPNPYFDPNDQFVVMADIFTDYYRRLHFGEIYYGAESWTGEHLYVHTSDIPPLLVHELGHSLGLLHAGSPNCKNIMIGQFILGDEYFTKNELNRIHRTLSTNDMHNFVDCEKLSEGTCDIEIIGDATIDFPMSVFGDIKVLEGNSLTITDQVFLSRDSEIFVYEGAKLIVDGGTLTNGCHETWKGIKVVGGNSDFDVKFTDAVIENTSSSAVSMFPPLPWPEPTQHGNGIIQADNTIFNNCQRMVEFIAFQSEDNPSYIRNCVQNGGKWGITNWNGQGIEISNNDFYDIENHCIGTERGSFLIQDNKFYSKQNDIFFNNTSAGIGSRIRNNQFYGENTGLRCVGTTLGQNEIFNNIFDTGYCDIWMDGDNHYVILKNNFKADFGTVHLSNGETSNIVQANRFQGSQIGIHALGENNNYRFIENCFDTDIMDVYVSNRISDIVATYDAGGDDLTAPAYNCFTHGGNLNMGSPDIDGSPHPFIYVEPKDNIANCADAILAHPNVNRQLIAGYEAPGGDCGTDEDDPQVDPPKDPCHPVRNIIAVNDALNILTAQKGDIENDRDLSDDERDNGIRIINICIRKVRRTLFELNIEERNFDTARNLFLGDNSLEGKMMIYSSYVYENNLANAREILESLPNSEEGIEDFKYIQSIQLDRLKNGGSYDATSNQLSKIQKVAEQTHPYAAYGKALYYAFTGEIIASKLPDVTRGEVRLKNNLQEVKKSATIFPNPFSELLNIDFGDYSDHELIITDFLRNVIFTNDKDSVNLQIDTSTWKNGVYIVTIKSEGDIVLQDKIILTHK